MKKILNNKSGFSLVELIITIILVFVLVSVGYLVINAGTSNYDMGSAKTHLQQNSRIIDDYIQSYLRKATSIVISSNDVDLLTNTIKVDGKKAVTNGHELTADVIDDFQIRIDESGDKPVIEYVISTSWEGETYELSNSVVLNNIPIGYFGGAYSSFTSIGSSSISYNNDILVTPNREITIYPTGIVKGTTYTVDDPVEFIIFVVNDIFVDGLNSLDASLSGDIDTLTVQDITKINDEQLRIFMYGTVIDDEGVGQITILEDAFEFGNSSLSVDLNIVKRELHHILIDDDGETDIIIPNSGEPNRTVTFNATAYDIFDEAIGDASVLWSLDPSSPSGVVIDDVTGVLSVPEGTSEGVIQIIATTIAVDEEGDHWAHVLYRNTIVDPGPTIGEIMDELTTLPFASSYDAYDSPTYVALPVLEGVTFTFTGNESTGISLESSSSILLTRHNNSTRVGTITLQGTKDSESATMTFNVTIPSSKSGGAVSIVAVP